MAGGKTKGGRLMNPADAFRKEQRKKEVARNKMERKFIRGAGALKSKPEELKKELQEIIVAEEDGPLSKTLKLRKKALQEAYDQAIKRKKEEDVRVKVGGAGAREGAAGPIALRPEDSPFYHPTLNPTGAPPPSKAGSMAGLQASKAPNVPALPVPKPPPLPAGPKPSLPPPPSASVLAKASMEQWLEPPAQPLPPPEGPPPPLLPPPDVAPPGFKLPPPPMPPPGRLPPPPGPPPGTHSQEDSDEGYEPPAPGTAAGSEEADAGGTAVASTSAAASAASTAPAPAGASGSAAGPGGTTPPQPMIPPPPGLMQGRPPPPPMGGIPPPPHLPPPGFMPPHMQQQHMYAPPVYAAMAPPMHGHYMAAPGTAPHHQPPKKDAAAATITGASTVVKRPLAQNDRTLTSMVPAALRVKRDEEQPKKKPMLSAVGPQSGFGLAPAVKPVAPPKPKTDAPSVDDKYLEFMSSIADLGGFE